MKFLKPILLVMAIFALLPVPAAVGDFSDRLGAFFGGTDGPGATEILKPDEAFRMSVHAAGNEILVVRWEIEGGYYLYHDKFALASRDDTVRVKGFSDTTR